MATHIVGGEMIYDQLGNNNYRITLKVYRDCYNGIPPFDGDFSSSSNVATAFITVYQSNGSVFFGRFDIGAPTITPIPPSINNPCILTPNNVCVEEGLYTYTLNLPPINGGYDIIYQRCCRNNTILNLVQPGGTGSTYYTHINGPEVIAFNSSPRFKKFPPIFICQGLNIAFDHSATDPDGDQLVYSLCAPFNGLDGCCPSITAFNSAPNTGSSSFCTSPPPFCSSVAIPPPFPTVAFTSSFTGSYPMASNPAVNINSITGFLNGKPTMVGQWVVGVCVQEFRAGNLIGTHYRDFQFNVVTCSVTVLSIIEPQVNRCEGSAFNFVNQSIGGTTFHWDFGVAATASDTSNLPNPSYTYQDTGKYVVSLITNPNKPCADTTKDTFYVYPKIDINFIPPPKQCLKGNTFDFNLTGIYINSATFKWEFTARATPSVATTKTVTNVVFDTSGVYVIKLVGKQLSCKDSVIDTIRVIDRPRAKIRNFPTQLCDPARVAFSNGSTSELPLRYVWYFSDGTTSKEFEPLKVFTPPGVYSITLTAITDTLCKDTSKFAINTVTVNPTPKADFVATPTITSIFDAEILFTDRSTPDVSTWEYDYGDGFGSNLASSYHTYRNYGDFRVTQKVSNVFRCRDSIWKDIKILPEHRFWIPNTFTPNNDELNDVFKPSIIGVENYDFEIYDRWGELIFKTNDVDRGWNGKIDDKLCKQDVYVWRITFKNVVSKKNELHIGHVLLLRSDF
jgi:gliding motility-associated-like protein